MIQQSGAAWLTIGVPPNDGVRVREVFGRGFHIDPTVTRAAELRDDQMLNASRLLGGAGNDCILAGNGGNIVFGGPGNDIALFDVDLDEVFDIEQVLG